jgi:hypothetical protein
MKKKKMMMMMMMVVVGGAMLLLLLLLPSLPPRTLPAHRGHLDPLKSVSYLQS